MLDKDGIIKSEQERNDQTLKVILGLLKTSIAVTYTKAGKSITEEGAENIIINIASYIIKDRESKKAESLIKKA
jgi:hypothetical protein